MCIPAADRTCLGDVFPSSSPLQTPSTRRVRLWNRGGVWGRTLRADRKYSKVKGAGMRGQEKEMDIHPSVLQGSWAKMMDLQWGIRTWSCTLNWIIFLKLKVTRKLWDLPKIPWKNMNGRFDSMEERSDWRNIKSPHVYTPSALRLLPQKHIRTYEKFRRLGWRHNFKLSKIQSNADKRP